MHREYYLSSLCVTSRSFARHHHIESSPNRQWRYQDSSDYHHWLIALTVPIESLRADNLPTQHKFHQRLCDNRLRKEMHQQAIIGLMLLVQETSCYVDQTIG